MILTSRVTAKDIVQKFKQNVSFAVTTDLYCGFRDRSTHEEAVRGVMCEGINL